ncbi:MAG: peptide chain release factor N(5)-glutamine methyltransferase [Armatimonadetes bacterium]|nr:peptide chain release factor N(5)-glutamine methyltransferase [Armatimonadota bacterium]
MALSLSVAAALRAGTERLRSAGVDSPEVDARVLLAHVLGCGLNDVFLRSAQELAATEEPAWWHLLELRASRMPLQYVTRTVAFCGLMLRCDDRALIPRQETELLAEAIADRLRRLRLPEDSVVVDVGCGGGAIALALAQWLPHVGVLASDVSPEALQLATENAGRLGLTERVRFARGPYLEPVFQLGLEKRVVAVVNNPPYVKPEEIPLLDPETLAEPRLAVESCSEDGLEEYRELARQAAHLPNLRLLGVEVGFGQAGSVREILGRFGETDTILDYCDIERHVIVHVQR